VRIGKGNGTVFFSKAGAWVASDCHVTAGPWQKISIQVDLERGCYSAFVGDSQESTICRDIAWVAPPPRTVINLGENIPIPVPSYKYFSQVCFVPEGPPGSIAYLDDVRVRWTPDLRFARPDEILFRDDFEDYPVEHNNAGSLKAAGKWQLAGAEPERATVYRGTSFGEGFKSLKATGELDLQAAIPELKLDSKRRLTLDCDLFVRSNKNFPFMIPDPLSKSAHGTAVRLETERDGSCVAGIRASPGGRWQIWDGDRFVDTELHVDHDVWNHLQMVVDSSTGSYRVVIQPLGGLPVVAGTAAWGGKAEPGLSVALHIRPEKSPEHLTLYDNVVVGLTHPPAAKDPPSSKPGG